MTFTLREAPSTKIAQILLIPVMHFHMGLQNTFYFKSVKGYI